MKKEVIKQILTNQLCIMATLETLALGNEFHTIQIINLEERIEETKKVREKIGDNK